ncbi:uncharacterized protein IL334_005974 [Kwoniella shivajii]|uniref:Golgi apparatus membrane protein TVP38 n=1 Tax=Kwoniella shivajii TaxID=564305 RepID=A0ABZ1D4L9_9TREE|nr:hypothetical protein IL334_005974 [Kwoniella shivajii]
MSENIRMDPAALSHINDGLGPASSGSAPSKSASPSLKTSTHPRPTFNHSSTSYATRNQTQSSYHQEPTSYISRDDHHNDNNYADDELPSKESLPSSSMYPPIESLHPYSHPGYTSTERERRFNGNRNRSVSLSLNEMWDKSRSVCSLKGEHGAGKSMMLGWIITTLIVLGILGWWRRELFEALDDLSKYLSSQGYYGHLIIFILILITTIPPIPLYSTLIVLSGYTFGVWEGFLISYAASLFGAVLVFGVSRVWLRDVIGRCLSSSPTSSTLLSLLSSHPHLLLLIRIAPYPYNLLNVILASSPSLSLRTYTACTALSLCKLVLHTWIGAGIHNLSTAYGHNLSDSDKQNGETSDEDSEGHWPSPHLPPPPHYHFHGNHGNEHGHGEWSNNREDIKAYSTWFGIALCIGLFCYLTYIAKKAVREAQREQEREMAESGQGLLISRRSEEGEEEV